MKQRAFVEAYIRLHNGTAAARVAGYNATYGSLRAIASQNLKKTAIKAVVEKAWQDEYCRLTRIFKTTWGNL